MLFFSILLGKLSSFAIRNVLNRNASTWPGHLVLESNPNFINKILSKNTKLKIVLIAGTNGKTTTTKALHHVLESNNVSSIRNDAGANLLNGFASLLIKYANLEGRINSDALLFEVDENSLPHLLSQLSTSKSQLTIVLLNLFRDQLDRYGEVNITSEKWKEIIGKISTKTKVIANADDPQIVNITKDYKGEKHYFSIDNSLKKEKHLSHAVDSTTCPNCNNELVYSKIGYSHIGNYSCKSCGFKNPTSITVNIKTSLMGGFNIYNLTAAAVAAKEVFGIKNESSINALQEFKPAFGRQEEIIIKGKKAIVLLSKNPTGFNESLKVAIDKKHKNLLVLLNDRIPDGKDISWIWDVDFELLSDKNVNITTSGDRTFDMANRLIYANIKNVQAKENLRTALTASLEKTSKTETLVILPTYSAMLEIRKIATGKSIL